MEAKDTIMEKHEWLGLSIQDALKDQAKISFRAGVDYGIERMISADFEFGKHVGIREVVEWGETVCMEHGMRKHRKCDKCWQAKPKEWGIV